MSDLQEKKGNPQRQNAHAFVVILFVALVILALGIKITFF
jgi:hypothetical protein